jgi:hypothetical protein
MGLLKKKKATAPAIAHNIIITTGNTGFMLDLPDFN